MPTGPARSLGTDLESALPSTSRKVDVSSQIVVQQEIPSNEPSQELRKQLDLPQTNKLNTTIPARFKATSLCLQFIKILVKRLEKT
jgi:hypothetical protein